MSTPTAPAISGDGPLQALLWDVDGTLAETELEGHRRAFNQAFADEGLPFHWDRTTYLGLLAISGGRERLRAFLSEAEGETPAPARIERLQERKQAHYGSLMRSGGLPLRPGVARLIRSARAAGLRQGIVTTSGRSAVEALCQGLEADLAAAFGFWICGEDVARKKPDPEAYRQGIHRLDLEPAAILAIEDSCNGMRAATGAGLACLVTLSASSQQEFHEQSPAKEPAAHPFQPALAVLDGLGDGERTARSLMGAPCPGGQVTLSWLQDLLAP